MTHHESATPGKGGAGTYPDLKEAAGVSKYEWQWQEVDCVTGKIHWYAYQDETNHEIETKDQDPKCAHFYITTGIGKHHPRRYLIDLVKKTQKNCDTGLTRTIRRITVSTTLPVWPGVVAAVSTPTVGTPLPVWPGVVAAALKPAVGTSVSVPSVATAGTLLPVVPPPPSSGGIDLDFLTAIKTTMGVTSPPPPYDEAILSKSVIPSITDVDIKTPTSASATMGTAVAGPPPSPFLPVQPIKLECVHQYSAVSCDAKMDAFKSLITVSAPPKVDSKTTVRPPLDLCLSLDVSGSMQGSMGLLQDCVTRIVSKLLPDDRIAVVTFATKALCITPWISMTLPNRCIVERTIKQLTAEGGTDLNAGIATALNQYSDDRNDDKHRLRCLFVLTDGKPETGIIDPTSIVAYTNKSVSKVDSFYTFGLSEQHNAQLLSELAQTHSSGTYCYIRETKTLDQAVSDMFQGQLNVVGRSVTVVVCGREHVDGIDTMYPITQQPSQASFKGMWTVQCGDIQSGETKSLLVQSKLEPCAVALNNVPLFDVIVTYDNMVDKGAQKVVMKRVTLDRYGADFKGSVTVSLEVDKERNRMRMVRTLTKVKACLTLNQQVAANQVLVTVAANQVLDAMADISGSISAAYCEPYVEELNQVFQSLTSKQFTADASAQLEARSLSHSRQRANVANMSAKAYEMYGGLSRNQL